MDLIKPKGEQLRLLSLKEDSMILFQRFLFDRQIMNDVLHRSIHWKTPNRRYMVALSWSLIKGDRWKHRETDAETFLGWDWKIKCEDVTRTGVYVGRLAVVLQTKEGEG